MLDPSQVFRISNGTFIYYKVRKFMKRLFNSYFRDVFLKILRKNNVMRTFLNIKKNKGEKNITFENISSSKAVCCLSTPIIFCHILRKERRKAEVMKNKQKHRKTQSKKQKTFNIYLAPNN